jgi:ABC-type dipeptide/oligopeptide/nickel transport system permease subunit
VISGYQWTNGMLDPEQHVQFFFVDPRMHTGWQPSQHAQDLVRSAAQLAILVPSSTPSSCGSWISRWAFPFYVLLIAILAILGPGLINMYYALILVGWIAFARLIRGEVLVTKKMEYVTAARALGCSDWRIIARHLLPNVIGPALVYAMSAVVLNILSGASLGFLGLGVQAPNPEWGVMIAEPREYITTAWWLPLFPGLAIALVGVAFSLLGDGLSNLLRRRTR